MQWLIPLAVSTAFKVRGLVTERYEHKVEGRGQGITRGFGGKDKHHMIQTSWDSLLAEEHIQMSARLADHSTSGAFSNSTGSH